LKGYKKTKHKGVYIKNGAYYLVKQNKWIWLCPESSGEPAMLRALARQRGRNLDDGSFTKLIQIWTEKELPNYAPDVQKDYGYMLPKIEMAFIDIPVADLTSHDVIDLRNQFTIRPDDAEPTWTARPRTAEKYHGLLSVLLGYAIDPLRWITHNPCRDVKKAKPEPRRVYMTDETMLTVVDRTMVGRRFRGNGKAWKNANGETYALLFLLAYLTAQRSKDLRLLRKDHCSDASIAVQPTKTKKSSGKTIDIDVTPDIRMVLARAAELHAQRGIETELVFTTLQGTELSKEAVKTAWRRARERAGLVGDEAPWMRDLRPKALSDAKRQGKSLEEIKDGAAHASVTTTEGYMRGFERIRANLGLGLPFRSTEQVSKS
jgi:integrase